MSFLIKNFFSLTKLGIAYLTGRNYPFVTVLRLNDACNMACSYCDSYKLSKSLEINPLISFLNKIYNQGCRFLILTGGEAFLYEHRQELMDWIKDKNIYLVINTNGKLIGKSEYDDFIKSADEVLISIDGPEEFNDNHRGKGTYQKVINTLEFLKSHKIKTTLSVVLTKYNTTIEVLDHIKDLKLKYNASVGINPVTPSGRINNTDYSNENAISESDLEVFRSYIGRNSKSFREVSNLLLDYIYRPRPFVCKTMRFALYIDVDKGIYPCINVTDREDARFSDIVSYNGKYKKEIKCNQCNCTPLIVGNLLLQKKIPSIKKVFSILRRHI